PPPVVPLPPQGPARSGVSQVDPAEPVKVAVDSGAESGGAEPAGAGTGVAESGGAESGRFELEGIVFGGAEPARAASGGALGVPLWREPLSPQQLHEWYSRHCQGTAGATGGAAGACAAGGAAGAAGAGDNQSRKEKSGSSKTTLTSKADALSRGEAPCSMAGVVTPTILQAPEAGEEF
ncbi:unnamed protein product, partial [Closterium sp. NIES-53]